MNAGTERGPRDGKEALFLRLFRDLGLREQRAWLDALIRRLDGQPLEDALVEALVELGEPTMAARRQVRIAMGSRIDWRRALN